MKSSVNMKSFVWFKGKKHTFKTLKELKCFNTDLQLVNKLEKY